MSVAVVIALFEHVAVGLIFTLLAGWVGMHLARRFGLMDIPGQEAHKQHAAPTPLAGGIAILIAFLLNLFVYGRELKDMQPVLLAGLVILVTGIIDDAISIRFWQKLVVEIAVSLLLIGLGVQVRVFASAFPAMPVQIAGAFDIFITLLWLVGMTNAFNFVDSMDGLATGVGLIAAIFLSAACIFSGQASLALFMAFMIGVTYGLHAFTSMPARLFLGDGGALALGFLLASAAMIYNPRIFPQGSSWFVPILILGVPIFDATLVVVSRLRRKRQVYLAGRDHTYHRLVAIGLEPNRAVLVMHVASVLLGCLAFFAMNQSTLWANIIFAAVLITGLVLLRFIDDDNHSV